MDSTEVRRLLEAAKTPLEKLRVPFPENQIGLLPRAVNKNDTQKFGCKPGTQASADGKFCGGYHPRSVHLDFVGHAALTDRLLEVDPEWDWRPLATDEYGMPKFDQFGGLWIELTVGGVSRLGYGDAQGKPAGSTAVKEVIGDALRNAGMRFGMALDLWHKGDLHDFKEEQGDESEAAVGVSTPSRTRAPRSAASKAPAGSEPTPAENAAPGAAWQGEDFLADAQAAPTSDDVLAVWRRAKAAGAPQPMLESIAGFGRKLKDAEEQASGSPTSAASDQLKKGFGGE